MAYGKIKTEGGTKVREIKFKIWDKEENQWFEPTYEAYNGHVEELLISPSGELHMRTLNHQHENVMTHESMFPNRFVKVQYTGLKDRNDKEIYEGYIVQFTDLLINENRKVIGTIGFSDGSFRIETDLINYYRLMDYDIEVIGNIYEHPQMLKE